VTKEKPCPVVCKKLFHSFEASRRLHKHDTCAPSSYAPLLLQSPSTRILDDTRVLKLAVLKIRVTRVLDGVRQPLLRDSLKRRNF
jgi:hypothetical protein